MAAKKLNGFEFYEFFSIFWPPWGPWGRLNPNEGDVWKALPGAGGGLLEPPYLSQPFVVRFSKFLCLVKACENRHWFLFHNWLPIVHRLAARGRQSGEGQSRQYFQVKNPKISIFSYKYVIYLKWKLKLCRIQIHDEKIWFDGKKYGKIHFSHFCLKTRLARCLRRLISQIFW